MKKLYISLCIIGLLLLSLVAAADTGWSIKNMFKQKDDLSITPHISEQEVTCSAIEMQNRQLLLQIIKYLGIEPSVKQPSIPTGSVVRDFSTPVRTGTAAANAVATKQPRIDSAFTALQIEQIRILASTADLQGVKPHTLGLIAEEIARNVEETDEHTACRHKCMLSGCTDGHAQTIGCACDGCGKTAGYSGAISDEIKLPAMQMEQIKQLVAYATAKGIHAQELANYIEMTAQNHLAMLDDDETCAYACQAAGCQKGNRDSTSSCICKVCEGGISALAFDDAVGRVNELSIENVQALTGVQPQYYAPGQ